MDPRKEKLLQALRAFVAQRPGLEFANYGDVSAYRSEMRGITRDRHHAEALLSAIGWRDSLSADTIIAATRSAYSGRLSVKETGDGFALDYCTGQYWPTEYRRAVCAVLSSALWYHWREDMPEENRTGDAIRKTAQRELGASIARRWFN